VKSALWISLCLLLAFAARSHNVRDVFIEGGIYFVDADCYSRMTRAQLVAEHPGTIVRQHGFENFPAGTVPHTTAPLDYVIVWFKGLLDLGFWAFDREKSSILARQTLDLGGALISPMVGVLTCGFLGWWARRLQLRHWVLVPFFFAISPILVHGTSLGRPDHQSLIILCIAVALAAEVVLAGKMSRGWGIVSGAAWGLALWVSLYEPVVLLAAVVLLWLVFAPKQLWAPERRIGWAVLAGVLLLALAIDRWRIEMPGPALREAFARWQQTIGEMASLSWRSPLLLRWLGLGVIAVPVLLFLARRADRRSIPVGLLLIATFLLTLWQIRWGYFLALVYAMSLPWQASLVRQRWLVWAGLMASLWPMLRDWDQRLFPTSEAERGKALRRRELFLLREVASSIRAEEQQGFLAPWWLSPALAYWSGQPGVAGSSHQSLPGIIDSSRFYLATDPAMAAEILRNRRVEWVVADEPSRAISTSATLLDVETPENTVAQTLFADPQQVPPFLVPSAEFPPARVIPTGAGYVTENAPVFYRLYRVDRAKLNL
jgi:hypothetical protein